MPRRSSSPTMRDIASKAKVSVGTVSRVLNRAADVDEALRTRVENVARKLGYQASARTRTVIHSKARIIGLILCNDFGISAAHSLLLLGVEEHCSEAGYYLLFARHNEGADVPGMVQTPGLADCLILAGAVHRELLSALARYGLKYVVLANHLVDGEMRGDAIVYEDAAGCCDATRYLAKLGHQDIWYIGDASQPWHKHRLNGYIKAMQALNLEPHIHSIALSDNEFENGQSAVSHILEQGWPLTAILAGSEELAFGAREGLRQHRREVPKDVSLIGFEHGTGHARGSNLTSVSVDMVEVGRQLARAAIAQIEEQGGKSGISIPATLVKRSTCRPLRKEEHMML